MLQKTNYPWGDTASITVTPEKPSEFAFYLRIPGWSDRTQVTVNGKAISGVTAGQYLALRRRWLPGDVVSVKFDLTTHVVEANPRVVDDYGRVAMQRGPLVYCLEQLDQPEGIALADVRMNVSQVALWALLPLQPGNLQEPYGHANVDPLLCVG